jgi:hypothetical protein
VSHDDEGSEVSGARQSQRRDENRRESDRDHRCLAGLVSVVLALIVEGVGAAVEPEGASQVIGLGWSALGLSLMGLIGAALWIAKPQLATLIMAAAGFAIVFSISMFAVIARPLFVVRRFWAEFGMRPKVRPEPKEAPSGESPVGQ